MQSDSKRSILHMDLDSFFVSVEILKDPSLKGKPVIVGGSAERGIVASCSYEARKYGIHSAMPSLTAKKLCPHAIFVKGSYEDYSKYSSIVTNIVSDRVPVLQKTSVDEFYADLSGLDTFFGSLKLSIELRERIKKETGLPISFGLSSAKIISKIATSEAKPDGYKYVEHGKEKQFLAPLLINKIPGVGEKTFPKLQEAGFEYIHQLQNTNIETLEELLGKWGHDLWFVAQGIDDSPVVPHSDRKSISCENTFDADSNDPEFLQTFIVGMVEQLAFTLRKENFLASCVAVKIRYTGFETHTQQMKIEYTNADHAIIPKVKEVFQNSFDKNRTVRLIGVKLSNLIHGQHQVDMFDDTEQHLKLYSALDKINKKFGSKTVTRAKTMEIKERGFNPFNGMVSE
ncbi:MAG: DNA polymerase IV [Fimbriimonadaceae bacterium]|nr:DNA polymerase IV [Chitinophagales bacterium]